MPYNPSTRVVLHLKDDTYIKANPVSPDYVNQLGTVRVVIGTSVELYLTPVAAAALVQQVAEHVDEVLAVVTGPAIGDRDEVPPITGTCIALRCAGAAHTTTSMTDLNRWMDGHAETDWHDKRWPVAYRIDYATGHTPSVAYRVAADGIASPADVIHASNGTSYTVGSA